MYNLSLIHISLGGSGSSAPAQNSGEGIASSGGSEPAANPTSDLNLDKISSMMSSMSGGNDRHVALLNALSPYLRDSRQAKIGTAIKAMQVIKVLGNLK